jgi:hypothetical protein
VTPRTGRMTSNKKFLPPASALWTQNFQTTAAFTPMKPRKAPKFSNSAANS